MSDFSIIEFAEDFPLLPEKAKKALRAWQTKDLPDDAERSCCMSGRIVADGHFIRGDSRGRFWNPTLTGLIRISDLFSSLQLLCRFDAGRVVEVSEIDPREWCYLSPEQLADCSDADWEPI